MLRYVSLLIALVFVLFSIVQLNDPDPLVWIAIYGSVVVMAVLVYIKKLKALYMWLMLPLFLVGSIYLWPDHYEGIGQPMSAKPGIEEARESLGLLIAFACVLLLIFISRKTYSTIGKQNETV